MIYLDANILLEVLLSDRPKSAAVANYLEEVGGETCLSMLTVHLIYHFCRQANVSDELLKAAIARHNVVSITPEDYAWAKSHEVGRDFEDALQIAVAVRAGCDQFVTLDRALARRYKQHLPTVHLA